VRSLGRLSRQVTVVAFLLMIPIPGAIEAIAGQLTLTWMDTSTNELGFSVERSTEATGTFGEIGTTGPSITTYTDNTVVNGITYCYRVRAFDATAYSDYSDIACATVAQAFDLAVVKMVAGAGSGTITSVPAGISCGTNCSESYAGGTVVTLTAVPAIGSTFTGWSVGACSSTGACTITVTATTTVSATFAGPPVTLTTPTSGSSPPLNLTLALNGTTFSSGDELTLFADVHVNSSFSNPVDAYVYLQDSSGSIRPVRSYINANIPYVDFSGVGTGALAGLPAGTYALSVVLVKAGGDPQNLTDRLSNFASISFIVR